MKPPLAAFALLAASLAAPLLAAPGIAVVEQADRVVVTVDGEPFTEYRFAGARFPYFFPVLGPGGVPLTRAYPMVPDRPDEEQDHPHHRGLWFTHGDVNGVDFWADGAGKGRIEHARFLELRGGADEGVIRSANRWVAPDGRVLLTDERTHRVHRAGPGRWLDFTATLTAPADGDGVTLGDTKEGTMAIRLAESLRLKPNRHHAGQTPGTIRQDTGARDGDTWGRRAAWTDYSGVVTGATGGRRVGVTIYDHPQNPRFPTWWHVRDYGLFAANPFGVHEFEKKPKGTGDLRIPAGQSVTFRYRFHFHAGGEPNPESATRTQW
jgi:hypothetical protein